MPGASDRESLMMDYWPVGVEDGETFPDNRESVSVVFSDDGVDGDVTVFAESEELAYQYLRAIEPTVPTGTILCAIVGDDILETYEAKN